MIFSFQLTCAFMKLIIASIYIICAVMMKLLTEGNCSADLLFCPGLSCSKIAQKIKNAIKLLIIEKFYVYKKLRRIKTIYFGKWNDGALQ